MVDKYLCGHVELSTGGILCVFIRLQKSVRYRETVQPALPGLQLVPVSSYPHAMRQWDSQLKTRQKVISDGTQKNRQPLESVHLETLLHNAESSLAFAKAHLSQSEVAIPELPQRH